jgi:hypothetical protein
MERVETLIQKLQQQLKEGVTLAQLQLTAQMLQYELAHALLQAPAIDGKQPVVISMPVNVLAVPTEVLPAASNSQSKPAEEEEKTVVVLQVDEAAVEAELEEIKRNAALMNQLVTNSKPQLLFDAHDDDIPTLSHGKPPAPLQVVAKEIHEVMGTESTSVNDVLKEAKVELSDTLVDTPVKDLKKAIGINDRFLYINELFRGDEVMYERSIKTINSFSIWPEAEYWIRRELKTKLGWIDTDAVVMQFDQLVKRRFS